MVTKQQQLEWMSKAHKEWPFILDYICMSSESVGNVSYVVGSHRIAKQEWQREQEKMQKQQDNSWHERGELPPVGVVCMAYITSEDKWIETEIVARRDGYALGWCHAEKFGCHGNKNSYFRPILTEREKDIDALIEIICAGGELSKDGSAAREIAERIHEAQQTKEKTK